MNHYPQWALFFAKISSRLGWNSFLPCDWGWWEKIYYPVLTLFGSFTFYWTNFGCCRLFAKLNRYSLACLASTIMLAALELSFPYSFMSSKSLACISPHYAWFLSLFFWRDWKKQLYHFLLKKFVPSNN